MKAIILISGGLDSMVSAYVAKKRFASVMGLTFDYGQRAARREIVSARRICKKFGIGHKVISIPWLSKITHSSLLDRSRPLPHPSLEHNKKGLKKSAKSVWVPNRNGLFVNIAAAFAEGQGAGYIVTGFNKEESGTFPDNSSEFVNRINSALKFSTLSRPKVVSFVQSMTKREMVRFAVKKRLPLELCWPCYEGGKKLCGKCESCARFLRAVGENNTGRTHDSHRKILIQS